MKSDRSRGDHADHSRRFERTPGQGGTGARRDEGQEHEIVLTRGGTERAVAQSLDARRRQRSALLMLKLMVQGETEIQARRATPQDRVFAEIRDRLTRPEDG